LKQTDLSPYLPTVATFLNPLLSKFTPGEFTPGGLLHSSITPSWSADNVSSTFLLQAGTVSNRPDDAETAPGSLEGAFAMPPAIGIDGVASNAAFTFNAEDGSISAGNGRAPSGMDSVSQAVALDGSPPFAPYFHNDAIGALNGSSVAAGASGKLADAMNAGGSGPLDFRARDGDLNVASAKQVAASDGEIVGTNSGGPAVYNRATDTITDTPSGGNSKPIVFENDPMPTPENGSGNGDSSAPTLSAGDIGNGSAGSGNAYGGGSGGGVAGNLVPVGGVAATVPDGAGTAALLALALAALAPAVWRRTAPIAS
jgi:hypothetical protein